MRGDEIYKLMEELWPICRSITGDGVRETLKIIKNKISDLKIIEVPSAQNVLIGKFLRSGM